MCAQGRVVSLGFTSEAFPAGTHICYLYNEEEERRRAISAYLRSGVEEGERVGYFPDVLGADMIEYALDQLGVAAAVRQRQDQFKVATAVDTYCPGGQFAPEGMVQRLRRFYDDGIATGHTGVRVSGEMTWSLRGIPGSDRLVEYEAQLNKLTTDVPLTMICQFDATRFDGATIFEILNVHPMMIVRGQVLRNPYYTPSDEYLATAGRSRHGA